MGERQFLISSRGTFGINFLHGPPREGIFDGFIDEKSEACKDMAFSKDGSLFAWCNGEKVTVMNANSFKIIGGIDRPKTSHIHFSPKGSYLSIWEPYSAKETAQDSCNLEIWDVKTMTKKKEFIQKRQTDWEPKWTDDEVLCCRNVNNEVHFYENADFSKISKKIFIQKVLLCSLSPGDPSYHVACYIPGVKAQPSFVRLFKFPKFEGSEAVIAQKSFFKADRAEFYWHKNGKDLIVQATVDVDKSGASYYGEQNLYYLSVKGETARIMLGKEGPIYSIEWSPNNHEFCVVYGFMPARATIYNLKCDAVFDFGTGPRNAVNYCLSGNRLILSGFGNLQGNTEVWDVKNRKQISKFVAQESTYISWSPNSEYILTATTSPRLRIGNGYRIWHYTGSLLQEKFVNSKDEILQIQWQPVPENSVKENPTTYTPVEGIQSCKPQASKEVYRPPGAKGRPSSFRLHVPDPPKDSQTDNSQKTSNSRNKKRNQARKAKKEQEKLQTLDDENITENQEAESPGMNVQSHLSANSVLTPAQLTGDPTTDKRIKALYKKLDQIEKLKQDQKLGKRLEINQVEKLKKEDEIIEELRKLIL